MNCNEYRKQFEEQVYEPVTTEFIKEILSYYFENKDDFENAIQNELDSFMEKIGRMQQIQPIKAGQITISVLRTSIWNEHPVIRLDCYDAGQEAGINIAYQYMNENWFCDKWANYKDRLMEQINTNGYQPYIRISMIEQFMSKTLDRLIPMYAASLKYLLNDADLLTHYHDLLIEDGFMITAGEYLDKQRILFASLPEVDIVANPSNSPVFFQKISDKKYRNQDFENMDLTGSRFINCEFSKCTFDKVQLIDTRFINCLFRNVQMKSGDMYGAIYMGCVLNDVDFGEMTFSKRPNEKDEIDNNVRSDIFRDTIFLDCVRDDKKMQKEGES